MRLLVLGLNHKSAPVATREAFAVASEAVVGLDQAAMVLEPAVAEAMIVSTCNRVELYAVAASDEAMERARAALVEVLAIERGSTPPSSNVTATRTPAWTRRATYCGCAPASTRWSSAKRRSSRR